MIQDSEIVLLSSPQRLINFQKDFNISRFGIDDLGSMAAPASMDRFRGCINQDGLNNAVVTNNSKNLKRLTTTKALLCLSHITR